ncbi:MAG: AI-2E family transporter [Comamonadaceae bacterium]|nr:AI-2E family transporter [Comamonadaceae bacterium]
MQLFIALALAYLLNPLVNKLERRGLNRTVSVLLVIFSLAPIGISLGAAVLLTLAVKAELSKAQLNIPAYATQIC